jgi:hypothetical protein
MAAVAIAAGFAYAAPAYTHERPLRRYVRAIQDEGTAGAIWDVASTEPGLDLEAGAPGGWTIDATAPPSAVRLGRYGHPFVFRTRGPSLGAAPARITSVTQALVPGGVELVVTVVPQEPGLAVTFAAPPDLTPARSNLPGVVRLGRWHATFIAPRPDGVVWRASFAVRDAAALEHTRVLVTTRRMPGGEGWQQLPAWLPQDRTVWTASATWILTPPPPGIAPVEPLR